MSLRESMKLMDKPSMVMRKGEEIDLQALQTYLQDNRVTLGDISIEQFQNGYSNLTYLVRCREGEFVLRRPPKNANIKSAHDMGREFKVLSLLKPVFDKVPTPTIYCEDDSVIGSPFYIMERVQGIILRSSPPKGMSLTPDLMLAVSENAIDNLAALHSLDIQTTGLIELGKPEGYAQRQVEGWGGRYEKSKTDDLPSMADLSEWISSNIPKDNPPCMIHNDYKYDNMVLSLENHTEIKAILDWEMATVGDPMMDLGTTLAYWSELADNVALKPFSLTWMPGNLKRQEVIDRYQLRTGKEVTNIVFYFAYASFKLGVICQQIYARYKRGSTTDARFASLIGVVNACGQNGLRAIEKDRISNW
ncbi:MAG: aminoglycoside phosphotransferase (APT) family kinase protein [Cyclobacteriaceae bacterium]|jgi:aminoglycoside phosphotransferase (APT) family kinase protein